MAMKKAVTKSSAKKRLSELKPRKKQSGKTTTVKTKATKTGRKRTAAKKSASSSLTTETKLTKQEQAIQKLVDFYGYELPKDWGKQKKTKKNKQGAGRPPAIDANTIRKLQMAFAYDCTVEEACIYSGIYPSTYYDFIKKQPRFSDTVALLRNIPVLLARKSLVNAVIEDPAQALKYLERKKKTEFSPKIELSHGGDLKHTHDLSPEAEEAVDGLVGMFAKAASDAAPSFVVGEDDED